jgi:hypothetical protein
VVSRLTDLTFPVIPHPQIQWVVIPDSPWNPLLFHFFILSFFHFSKWSIPHARGCSQRGQRRRQRGYRYANHRLPKTVLFHKLLNV